MKQILILGHTGFIGRHLTNTFLKKDWRVIGVSRGKTTECFRPSNLIQHQLDLKTEAGLQALSNVITKYDCNIMVNLVWDVSANCHSSLNSIDSQYDVLRIARVFINADVTGYKELICAGTNAEYRPDCSDGSPLIEYMDRAILPDSIYGACKYATYRVLEKMCADHDIAFKWPRIFSAFGPGMRPTCFMPALVKALKNKEVFKINNGLTITHFTPVEFVTDIIYQLIDKHPGETLGAVNVATDKGISVNEVATILINTLTNPRESLVDMNYTRKTEQIPSLAKLESLVDTRCMKMDIIQYIKLMMQHG